MLPARLETDAEELAKAPLPAALEQALRTLGRALYAEVQTTEEMRAVAERVCAVDQANAARLIAVLDGAWNGIGRGDDRWLN
jgi:hypothetical protein